MVSSTAMRDQDKDREIGFGTGFSGEYTWTQTGEMADKAHGSDNGHIQEVRDVLTTYPLC